MRQRKWWQHTWHWLSERLQQLWRWNQLIAQRAGERHIFLLAAGVAFAVALCFAPLGLVALWILAGVVSPAVVEEALSRGVFAALLPSEELRAVLTAILHQLELVVQKRSAAGIIGIVGLLWTASALLQSVRTGLHAALGVQLAPRWGLFLWGRLRDVVLTVVLLGLTLVVSAVLIGWSIVATWGISLLPMAWRTPIRWFVGTVAALVVEVALYGFLFRFVPMVRLPWRALLLAVVVAVLLTELLRIGFVWYLEHLAPWGWVYGGYAALVSLFVWTYSIALIVLLSAVACSVVVGLPSNEKP